MLGSNICYTQANIASQLLATLLHEVLCNFTHKLHKDFCAVYQLYVHTYVYMYVCLYVCTYACIIYMCVHLCTMHIHIYLFSLRSLPSYKVIDFHKVDGLKGAYIASQINSDNQLESFITFDKGGVWQHLVPPSQNADGHPVRCEWVCVLINTLG